MKISIQKYSGGFVADRIGLPGSPLVGRGKTPMEALGSLFYCLQEELKISVDVSALEDSDWDNAQFAGDR